MKPERRMVLLRLFTLVFVIALIVGIYLNRERIQELYHLGYVGIFLITMLSNATVFLPVPGVMVVFAMGGVFQPFFIALFAGMGAAIGELSGYLVGFSGQGLAERSVRYTRLLNWMERNRRLSDLMILILAAIPNPFFDLAGIAAGTLKIPLWRFLVFCMLGSILKMLAFAYAGRLGLNWIYGLYQN